MIDVLGWLCGGVAFLQFIGGLLAVYSLCRKSVPEFWGIDWIDILFRIESALDIEFHPADFRKFRRQTNDEITAGELFEIVEAKLAEVGRPTYGAWGRMKIAIHEALNVSPRAVRRDSRLYADLRMD